MENTASTKCLEIKIQKWKKEATLKSANAAQHWPEGHCNSSYSHLKFEKSHKPTAHTINIYTFVSMQQTKTKI